MMITKEFNEIYNILNIPEGLYFDEHKLIRIDLHKFSTWLQNNPGKLTIEISQAIRQFIQAKINNGTLYTPLEMMNYTLSKRYQLFNNSNIAEHAFIEVIGGSLLDGNDILTLTSEAVIGEDGCAEADVKVGDLEVEIKVTYSEETCANIFKKAHKKPIVCVYIISRSGSKSHWQLFIKTASGYLSLDDNMSELVKIIGQDNCMKYYNWQNNLRTSKKSAILSLLYFDDEFKDDLGDVFIEVSQMLQK